MMLKMCSFLTHVNDAQTKRFLPLKGPRIGAKTRGALFAQLG